MKQSLEKLTTLKKDTGDVFQIRLTVASLLSSTKLTSETSCAVAQRSALGFGSESAGLVRMSGPPKTLRASDVAKLVFFFRVDASKMSGKKMETHYCLQRCRP